MRFTDGQNIHFIGIGGFGISAIARILLERGFSISGSDRNSNALAEALVRDGATIYQGHSADYVKDADMVIATSAVGEDHVEVVAAKEQGIPVYKRRDILAPLMEGKKVIAIAGTHGKTSTTSMVVHILLERGLDPSYIVGGVMPNTGTNAGEGKSGIFVIEADEYDNMFLGLKPDIAVITSIEYDHPDFFKSEEVLIKSFREFVGLLAEDGVLLACGQYPIATSLAEKRRNGGNDVELYASGDGRWSPENITISEDGITSFTFSTSQGSPALTVKLSVPGMHNIMNAIAAIYAVQSFVSCDDAAKALATFKTTGRRFDIRGEMNDIIVVDDYAHHPTAVKTTLEATRMRYPEHTAWAVWQPHMYSRTQQLVDDFAVAFDAADHVIVTDIYFAREDPIDGVDGAWMAGKIKHDSVRHKAIFSDIVDLLVDEVNAPAVIIIMSAGDAPKIGEDFLNMIEARQ
jgi:UDP-N-acetylmuramate--alanine ligase